MAPLVSLSLSLTDLFRPLILFVSISLCRSRLSCRHRGPAGDPQELWQHPREAAHRHPLRRSLQYISLSLFLCRSGPSLSIFVRDAAAVLHKGVYVLEDGEESLKQEKHKVVREVGNVTADTELTFEYGIRAEEMDSSVQAIPFQVPGETFPRNFRCCLLRPLRRCRSTTRSWTGPSTCGRSRASSRSRRTARRRKPTPTSLFSAPTPSRRHETFQLDVWPI